MSNSKSDNKNVVTIPTIDVKARLRAGYEFIGAKTDNKTAASAIRAAGGYVPDGASNELLTIAASVITNAKAAATAGRKVAIALALMEESGEYASLKAPNGRAFKSAGELFSALFPTLAYSTTRSYLNAGKTIYLPAMRGELEEGLMPLANLEPGTALSACAALNDAEARKRLPATLKAAQGDSKRLTQSMVKSAVKAARTADKPKDESTDNTVPTKGTDAKAAFKSDVEAMYVAIKKLFRPDFSDGDLHYLVTDSDRKAILDIVKSAAADADKATVFVTALLKTIPSK